MNKLLKNLSQPSPAKTISGFVTAPVDTPTPTPTSVVSVSPEPEPIIQIPELRDPDETTSYNNTEVITSVDGEKKHKKKHKKKKHHHGHHHHHVTEGEESTTTTSEPMMIQTTENIVGSQEQVNGNDPITFTLKTPTSTSIEKNVFEDEMTQPEEHPSIPVPVSPIAEDEHIEEEETPFTEEEEKKCCLIKINDKKNQVSPHNKKLLLLCKDDVRIPSLTDARTIQNTQLLCTKKSAESSIPIFYCYKESKEDSNTRPKPHIQKVYETQDVSQKHLELKQVTQEYIDFFEKCFERGEAITFWEWHALKKLKELRAGGGQAKYDEFLTHHIKHKPKNGEKPTSSDVEDGVREEEEGGEEEEEKKTLTEEKNPTKENKHMSEEKKKQKKPKETAKSESVSNDSVEKKKKRQPSKNAPKKEDGTKKRKSDDPTATESSKVPKKDLVQSLAVQYEKHRLGMIRIEYALKIAKQEEKLKDLIGNGSDICLIDDVMEEVMDGYLKEAAEIDNKLIEKSLK